MATHCAKVPKQKILFTNGAAPKVHTHTKTLYNVISEQLFQCAWSFCVAMNIMLNPFVHILHSAKLILVTPPPTATACIKYDSESNLISTHRISFHFSISRSNQMHTIKCSQEVLCFNNGDFSAHFSTEICFVFSLYSIFSLLLLYFLRFSNQDEGKQCQLFFSISRFLWGDERAQRRWN